MKKHIAYSPSSDKKIQNLAKNPRDLAKNPSCRNTGQIHNKLLEPDFIVLL